MDRLGVRAEDETWGGLVPQVQAAVAASVPAGIRVLVAADGFEPLLVHAGRQAANFPQDGLGRPVHHRLPDGDRAVWHLEALRAKGFGAIVFPRTARWWLDHYGSLRDRLDQRYVTTCDDEWCRIYDIGGQQEDGQAPRLDDVLALFEAGLGRLPSVLDCGTGADLAYRLRDAPVATAGPRGALDHVDQSIDLVVVPDDAAPHVVAEARRVATVAVATCTGPIDDPRAVHLWRTDVGADPPPVVLVVDLAGAEDPAAHLRAVVGSAPAGLFSAVIAVVDPGQEVRGLAGHVQVQVRGAQGLAGLLAAAEQEVSRGISVLLGPLALPVDGCAVALVRTLVADPDLAAVCGCLVDPMGLLRAAGGVLLADGDVVAYGDTGTDPFLPRFRCVRPVSACPPPLLAVRSTPTSAQLDLRRLSSTEGHHAALSLALRAQGGRLAYQPEAFVIDLRPDVGLRTVPPDDRAALAGQWPALLDAAPRGLDGLTWYDLDAYALGSVAT